MFKKHFDTKKLRYAIGFIPDQARLIITEKCHGTSGRTGHLLVKKDLPWWQAQWNRTPLRSLYAFRHKYNWEHVSGSRNIVLRTETETDQYYKGSNFRQEIHKQLILKKGETLYYEIVGYNYAQESESNSGLMSRPIMGVHKLVGQDPIRQKLVKIYGESMVYSYGCAPGQYRILVYRITNTNIDNETTELSWDQVQSRCAELGLETVPYISTLVMYELNVQTEGFVNQNQLMEFCEHYTSGQSTLDRSHIIEGVCIRVEHPSSFGQIYKYKGYEFCHLEGIAKNTDTYIDLEEIS